MTITSYYICNITGTILVCIDEDNVCLSISRWSQIDTRPWLFDVTEYLETPLLKLLYLEKSTLLGDDNAI